MISFLVVAIGVIIRVVEIALLTAVVADLG